jgi:hypothetical protein
MKDIEYAILRLEPEGERTQGGFLPSELPFQQEAARDSTSRNRK